jgi:hypothetical protein
LPASVACCLKAALVVGVGLAILQQVTGINTVIYYAPTIVEFTGVDSSAGSILAAVGVGVFVPETKGKRLEDIQEYFQDRVDHREAGA